MEDAGVCGTAESSRGAGLGGSALDREGPEPAEGLLADDYRRNQAHQITLLKIPGDSWLPGRVQRGHDHGPRGRAASLRRHLGRPSSGSHHGRADG
eukprot:6165445-Lingulodinium_polyedra.AAC.1